MDLDAHTKPPSTRRWMTIVLGTLLIGGSGVLYIIGGSFTMINHLGARDLIAANAIDVAVTCYRAEYGHLPPSSVAVIDSSTPEGVAFLIVLLGRENGSGGSANPRHIPFLTVKEGKRLKGGLNYGRDGKLVGLFDDWGHPYRIFLDTAAKGSITLPSGRVLTGRAAIAVSSGSDGKPDTADDIITGEPFPRPDVLNRLRRSFSF